MEKVGVILSSPRRVVSTIFALIVVLAIPLTVLMVNQQQDLRQRAAETQGIGVIAGIIWEDKNGNGVKNVEDTGFQPPNTKVKLSRRDRPEVDRLATPGVNGRYDFNIFNQASFVLSLEGLPSGYRVTKSPNNGTAFAFPVAPGGGVNFDFLVKPPTTAQPTPTPFELGFTPTPTAPIGRLPTPTAVPRPGDPLPKGWLDGASCQQFSGWTCDGSDWNRSVEVHFYKDALADEGGTFIGKTIANVPREAAVASECGGKNAHGYVFSTPNVIEDGEEHDIYAYAVNQDNPIHANNTLLAGSPKTLTCGTLPPEPEPQPEPEPEPQPEPEPEPQPGDVLVNFAFTLPGISDERGGNINPTRSNRSSAVLVFNSSNQFVESQDTDAFFENGVYSGTVNLGPINPGSYTIKIQTDNSLTKAAPGIIALSEGENNLSQLKLITGDLNGNNQMDISDYNILIGCIQSQEESETCALADLNDDGEVEGLTDLNILYRAFATIKGD